MRVKITGYYNVPEEEQDTESSTGLTEEAYLDQVADENGMGLKVADLDDVTLEAE
jgi:hypothetical protein